MAVDLRFVAAASFANVEDGADAIVGDGDNVLVPEGGDVMFYGDGGAGKTTMMVDLAIHRGRNTTGRCGSTRCGS